MFRNTRSLWKGSMRALESQQVSRVSSRQISLRAASGSVVSTYKIPKAALVPRITTLVHSTQYATAPSGRNTEEEKKIGQQKLESHPESVTSESSVRHLWEPSERGKDEGKPMSEDIKHDLNVVKDAFALSSVPKESYVLGFAGTIPYVITSASTVYLSWVLNTPWPTTSGFKNNIMISHESATYWLNMIEPIQLGYGAVIIGFLGAIHWGLEYAEKKPNYERTRFRYGLGVLASAAAVPTIFMPWQWALTSQFAAFVGMYFADTRAAQRGWAPHWYETYRFVLTGIVGTAIVITLIGRSKVGDAAPRLYGSRLDETFHQNVGEQKFDEKWEQKEREDKENAKKEAEEAEKKKAKKEAKGDKGSDKGEKNEKKDEAKGDKNSAKGEKKEKKDEGKDVDSSDDGGKGEEKNKKDGAKGDKSSDDGRKGQDEKK